MTSMIPFSPPSRGILLLTLLALCPVTLAQEEPAGEKDPFVPAFKENRKREKEYFERARAYFQEKDYKKAASSFKKSKRGAATDQDEAIIDGWILSCAGGIQLLKYEILTKRGQKSAVFFGALEDAQKFKGTAVEEEFRKLAQTLESEVLYPFEDFEVQDSKLSEKYGKKYALNAPDAFHGKSYLKWEQTKDKKGYQLKRTQVPGSFAHYQSLVFWMRVERPAEMEIAIRTPGTTGGQVNAFMKKHRPKKTRKGEWTRVEIPFSEFSPYGKPSLNKVESILIQVPDNKDFSFHLDYLCLIKKDARKPSSRR